MTSPTTNINAQRPKVYVRSPEEAPEGVRLHTGPRGGLFYFLDEVQTRATGKPVKEGLLGESRPISLSQVPERIDLPPTSIDWARVFPSKNMEELAESVLSGWRSGDEMIASVWQNVAAQVLGLESPYISPAFAAESYTANVMFGMVYYDTQRRLAEAGIESLPLFRGMQWFIEDVPDEIYAKISESEPVYERTLHPREGEEIREYFYIFDVEVEHRPLSSWTTAFSVASFFSDPFSGPYSMDRDDLPTEPVKDDEYYSNLLDAIALAYPDKAKSPEELEQFIEESGGWEEFEYLYRPKMAFPQQISVVLAADIPSENILSAPGTGLSMEGEEEYIVMGDKHKARAYVRVSQYIKEYEEYPVFKPPTAPMMRWTDWNLIETHSQSRQGSLGKET